MVELKHNSIEISPEMIASESIRFGALIKVIEDWQNQEVRETAKYTQAKFVMASLAVLSGNIPEEAGVTPDQIANLILELFSNRRIDIDETYHFAFPVWEEDVSLFDRDLGDMGLFTVFSALGFHLGFDAIEIAETIYPYRPLVLQYAREGYLQGSEKAIEAYGKMKDYYLTNPNVKELFIAVCNVVKE